MADRAPYADTATSCARYVAEVSPDDNVDLYQTAYKGLWVGGAGNVAIETVDGTQVTFEAVAAGTLLPVVAKKVLQTGTTVTAIIWALS